ncbi:MAG: acetylornithine transaminase [Vicinamibacteria bacterium]
MSEKSRSQELRDRAARVLMNTYRRLPVAIVRGRGREVWDADGKRYLDFVAGIAVVSLGHGHPGVSKAIETQLDRLGHISNLYYSEPQVRLAERLCSSSFADRVFFCNSGAEAVEAALKLARRYARRSHGANRYRTVALTNSFHGRTFLALSATHHEEYRQPFEPLVPGFDFAPPDDLRAIEKLLGDETAAVIVEPIQGEGGVVPLDGGFLRELRRLTSERDILLVFDEIQTGMGRTGKLFAYEHFDVIPDVMTLAKALGNGFPIGACLASEEVASAFVPGDHATTFGGNPLACAAALAVLEALLDDGVLRAGAEAGQRLRAGLEGLARDCSVVRGVRGLGLHLALLVSVDAKTISERCAELGLLVNAVRSNALRLVPPLTVTGAEIDEALAILRTALREAP